MPSEGKTGKTPKIERLKVGDKERTAMHADVMNEIIDAVNLLYEMKFSPENIGEVMYADGNIVLKLNTEPCDQ